VGALSLTCPADRGADPRNPGYGTARAGKAKTTTGAAHPRSLAPASGTVRPPGRGPASPAGAVRRVRRTAAPPPRPAPPADRRPGRRAPSARGARLARGSDPGRGGAAGMATRVRLTRDHPHGAAGMGRVCGSRATTPTLCCAAVPTWCCGAAPTSWTAAATGVRPAGDRCRWSSCARSRRVGPAVAWAGSLPYPRPEREPAADHPVPDAARVGALPGGAAHALAVKADAAQVGLTAAA
jgi:hypothetical protein